MKLRIVLILLVCFLPAAFVLAQDTPSAAERAENLRAQLRDVQAYETELQLRVQQLDWDLRPENIERHFASVGTTRPEELREQRRRHLQLEKDGAVAQLDQLAASRLSLENAISQADAEAYHQSALGSTALTVNHTWGARNSSAIILFGVLGFIAIGGALAVISVIRKR